MPPPIDGRKSAPRIILNLEWDTGYMQRASVNGKFLCDILLIITKFILPIPPFAAMAPLSLKPIIIPPFQFSSPSYEGQSAHRLSTLDSHPQSSSICSKNGFTQLPESGLYTHETYYSPMKNFCSIKLSHVQQMLYYINRS